ncbi:dihydrofolate reductase [Bacillus pumilus]|uniref:dihydrofolate reductase n=1 Tax=Bacillus pumilus TaxID=1408 RepID=UPI0028144AF9|nr:dihydrofolate reductase [Bacillus pumilus]MDR0123060.1 dihydrofolate reductase [Bacillus pumilus]
MISIVAACDMHMGIGLNGNLLYSVKEDMKRFKELTEGKLCIQGRKTYESIIKINGKPLSNRINVVLTKDKTYKALPGTFVYHSIDEVLKLINGQANHGDEVMIIGGSEIYKQFLNHADNVYLTMFHDVSEADSYFPSLDDNWLRNSSEHHYRDKVRPIGYSFIHYKNTNNI